MKTFNMILMLFFLSCVNNVKKPDLVVDNISQFVLFTQRGEIFPGMTLREFKDVIKALDGDWSFFLLDTNKNGEVYVLYFGGEEQRSNWGCEVYFIDGCLDYYSLSSVSKSITRAIH